MTNFEFSKARDCAGTLVVSRRPNVVKGLGASKTCKKGFRAVRRTGSPGEVAGWVGTLQSGALTRQGVAFDFLSGPSGMEYRGIVVAGYYNLLLHRPGSQMEISGWVNSGLDQFNIRVGIETSGEFFTNG